MEKETRRSGALQASALDALIRAGKPTRIITNTGVQLHGIVILEHDDEVILFRDEGKVRMIYKHAVSTVDAV